MKTLTTFTQLEKTVLRNYLPKQNAFDFGESPMKISEIGQEIWINEKVNLTNETVKGVVGSLVKKGVLECEDYGQGQFIWLDDIFPLF